MCGSGEVVDGGGGMYQTGVLSQVYVQPPLISFPSTMLRVNFMLRMSGGWLPPGIQEGLWGHNKCPFGAALG